MGQQPACHPVERVRPSVERIDQRRKSADAVKGGPVHALYFHQPPFYLPLTSARSLLWLWRVGGAARRAPACGRVGCQDKEAGPTHGPMSSAEQPQSAKPVLHECLPKAGLVYSEKGNLSEVLCKPKILPIKSITLEKLEQMEAAAAKGQPPGTNTLSMDN